MSAPLPLAELKTYTYEQLGDILDNYKRAHMEGMPEKLNKKQRERIYRLRRQKYKQRQGHVVPAPLTKGEKYKERPDDKPIAEFKETPQSKEDIVEKVFTDDPPKENKPNPPAESTHDKIKGSILGDFVENYSAEPHVIDLLNKLVVNLHSDIIETAMSPIAKTEFDHIKKLNNRLANDGKGSPDTLLRLKLKFINKYTEDANEGAFKYAYDKLKDLHAKAYST